MTDLLIKVCGMKDPENILAVAQLDPDYMGFIFYKASPRYAGSLDPLVIRQVASRICKVGVFVNETEQEIRQIVNKYDLQAVQLHGDETPAMCKTLKEDGIRTIKALPVAGKETFDLAKTYETSCDYLLFDTKTKLYGGSGQKFDWSLLDMYKGSLPFLLSGGIGPDDIHFIMKYRHMKIHAIDVNSGFEIAPGIKDIQKLGSFIRMLRR
jgi:phosphoribosylanthranilate isomerase